VKCFLLASQTREQNREAVAKKYNLPEADIRDTVTISQLLYRQIERCNQAGGSNESLNFEGCVDVLFQMVPNNVRTAVVHRVKDYKQTTERPVYKTNAGVQMGTIEHPVRLPDGSIWSPIMEKSEFIDYRLLFNIIMQELESAKITWRYDSMTMELGKVDEVEIEIPVETQERAKLFLEDLTRKDNATGYIYTYWELCKKITPDVPPPTPGREGYKGTNADFDVDDNEDITEGTEPLKQEEEEESDMEIEQGEEKNE
jgi:hypothetical protein